LAFKVLLSWSSGKDSAWTLHVLRTQGSAPAALLTTINEAADRVAMHAVRTDVLRAQAEAAGLPLISVAIPSPCPNDIYESRMAAVVQRAHSGGFTHVAFGDLFLEDVRRYREDRLAGSGLTPIFPLWGRPTDTLGREMIAAGVEAYLTCVDPRVVPASFAGRRYDAACLSEFSSSVDPCGERGEFHTCVVDGPMFSKRIDIRIGETVQRDGFVFTDVLLENQRPAATPPGEAATPQTPRERGAE
jgi:uncharacterized protein (TIGR00290 family)